MSKGLSDILGTIMFILVLGGVIGLFIFALRWDYKSSRKPAFVDGVQVEIGDILYTDLSNDKVQVTMVRHGWVHCRVASGRRYRDGIVSKDSYIQEYTVVRFGPFELTREKESK